MWSKGLVIGLLKDGVSNNADDWHANSISFDTREEYLEGSLFIPLEGKNYNANNFISEARKKGAVAALTSSRRIFESLDFNMILVSDTKLAMMKLACYRRQVSKAIFIAITGSYGKTTLKEWIYIMLSKYVKVHKTYKNHNNIIGVSQALINMPTTLDVFVVEIGINDFLEMDVLAKLVMPDYSIITAADYGHIGNFMSMANLIDQKLRILRYTKRKAFVYSAISHIKNNKYHAMECKVERVGKLGEYESDVSYSLFARNLIINIEGMYINLDIEHNSYFYARLITMTIACLRSVFGRHFVNLCSVKQLVGDLKEAALYSRANVYKGKLINIDKEFTIFDDSYNANYGSMKEALLTFKTHVGAAGKKIGIIGTMKEMGLYAQVYHQMLLPTILDVGFSFVVFVGPETRALFRLYKLFGRCTWFRGVNERSMTLFESCKPMMPSNSYVFIKGSKEVGLFRLMAE